jgi:hypothetical protein
MVGEWSPPAEDNTARLWEPARWRQFLPDCYRHLPHFEKIDLKPLLAFERVTINPLAEKRYFVSRNSEIQALECAIAIQKAFAAQSGIMLNL